jgi:hypothetical protein
MTLRIVVVALAIAASALTACGAEKPSATTSAPSMTRATTSDAPTGAPASESRETETVDEESEHELIGFTSPTGAIGCILDDTYVRCDVQEHTWTLPPRPADCEFDYGQGVGMATGQRAEIVCAGDTTLFAGDPLPYGQSVTAGPLSCRSAETGVTCRDAGTGHGFTVARESYEIV